MRDTSTLASYRRPRSSPAVTTVSVAAACTGAGGLVASRYVVLVVVAVGTADLPWRRRKEAARVAGAVAPIVAGSAGLRRGWIEGEEGAEEGADK